MFNQPKWYLQQDNDPSHGVATQELKQWNATNAANVQLLLNWPPNSPDLNIVENIWGIVQQKVNSIGCRNLKNSGMLWKKHLLPCLSMS